MILEPINLQLFRYSLIEFAEPLLIKTVLSLRPIDSSGKIEYREVGKEWIHHGSGEWRGGERLFLSGLEVQYEHELVFMTLHQPDVRTPLLYGVRLAISQRPQNAPTATKILVKPMLRPMDADLWADQAVEHVRSAGLCGHLQPDDQNELNQVELSLLSNRITRDHGLLQAAPQALAPLIDDVYRDRVRPQRVFIAHGKDGGGRDTIARVLENLGIEPVILIDNAYKGRTVIEQLEAHSDVHFAIILLTADDQCIDHSGESIYRSRPNVVFELGYFLSRLGRGRVCVLNEESAEVFSNYSGVLSIKWDKEGSWKLKLATELKNAGLSIDLNRLG